jgi:membrane protease YdiL (CAAX protease family)
MLSEKPWKTEAVLRLFASVLLCVLIGTLAASMLRIPESSRPADTRFFLVLAAGAGVLFVLALFVLRRPWRFEHFTRSFVSLLVSVYLGLALMWWAVRVLGEGGEPEDSTGRVLIAVLSFQGMSLVLVWRFVREHACGWREAFGLDREVVHALLAGVLVGASLLPICQGLQMLAGFGLDWLKVPIEEQQTVQVLRLADSWSSRVMMAATAVGLAPVAEEILFRGILYPAIRRAGWPRLALWGTSLVFAAIHFNLVTFLPLLVLALVLTWLYDKTNNLLAPVAAHSLFNAMNLVLLLILKSRLGNPDLP